MKIAVLKKYIHVYNLLTGLDAKLLHCKPTPFCSKSAKYLAPRPNAVVENRLATVLKVDPISICELPPSCMEMKM